MAQLVGAGALLVLLWDKRVVTGETAQVNLQRFTLRAQVRQRAPDRRHQL